jgi:hypothetical protein
MLTCGGRSFPKYSPAKGVGEGKIVPQQKGDVVVGLKLEYFRQGDQYAY